jgi:hypothetical protein
VVPLDKQIRKTNQLAGRRADQSFLIENGRMKARRVMVIVLIALAVLVLIGLLFGLDLGSGGSGGSGTGGY